MDNKEDKNWNKKYSPQDYKKTVYSFKPSEIAKLAPWDAQAQLGAIAEKVAASILRNECLKRVGVKDNADTGVEFNLLNEQFTVYEPRIICSLCKNKRAEFSVKDKYYCSPCVEILKAQIKPSENKEQTDSKKEKKK